MSPTTEPQEVWRRLMAEVAQRPAMAWLKHTRLRLIEAGVVQIVPIKGHREVIGFATEARCEPIAKLLAQIIGRPVRVEIVPEARQSDAPDEQVDTQRAPIELQREALNLPLIKQLQEEFDLTLLWAQKRTPPHAAADDFADPEDASHAPEDESDPEDR